MAAHTKHIEVSIVGVLCSRVSRHRQSTEDRTAASAAADDDDDDDDEVLAVRRLYVSRPTVTNRYCALL